MFYIYVGRKRKKFAKQYCQLVTENLIEQFHSTVVCSHLS